MSEQTNEKPIITDEQAQEDVRGLFYKWPIQVLNIKNYVKKKKDSKPEEVANVSK